jgi:hypothetical protein
MVTNLRVPQNVGNFFRNCTAGGFSRRAQFHDVRKLVMDPHQLTCIKPPQTVISVLLSSYRLAA